MCDDRTSAVFEPVSSLGIPLKNDRYETFDNYRYVLPNKDSRFRTQDYRIRIQESGLELGLGLGLELGLGLGSALGLGEDEGWGWG